MWYCVCVFVGGKEGEERVFKDCGRLVPAHGFPSECAYQLTFLDIGSDYSFPSA